MLKAKAETLRKEIALRKLQASRDRQTPLTQKELDRIEADATTWVENGVKATTNKRLGILRAMFYTLAKRGDISKSAIPFSRWLLALTMFVRINFLPPTSKTF